MLMATLRVALQAPLNHHEQFTAGRQLRRTSWEMLTLEFLPARHGDSFLVHAASGRLSLDPPTWMGWWPRCNGRMPFCATRIGFARKRFCGVQEGIR
jgi:hypothetical protein